MSELAIEADRVYLGSHERLARDQAGESPQGVRGGFIHSDHYRGVSILHRCRDGARVEGCDSRFNDGLDGLTHSRSAEGRTHGAFL